MTITFAESETPPPGTPRPSLPPPQPKPPTHPPSRGDHIPHAGQLWRVDVIHMCHAVCTRCGRVHDAYTLGRPGVWLTRVPGCEVSSA